MYYNFVRIHKTLRMTPAMAAGVSEKLWEIGNIAKLVEDAEAPARKRGPYNKRLPVEAEGNIFPLNLPSDLSRTCGRRETSNARISALLAKIRDGFR